MRALVLRDRKGPEPPLTEEPAPRPRGKECWRDQWELSGAGAGLSLEAARLLRGLALAGPALGR